MVWKPIETAPRDGTIITLTWMDGGEPQEIYPGFQWNPFASNHLVQGHKGIWAIHGKNGELLMTWSEDNPDGAPTHWMPRAEKEARNG